MAKVHLVMPMAGAGSRFAKQGYDCPKPLMHIQGKPFFYWAVMSVAGFVRLHDITFVVLQEHVEQHHIDRAIHEFFPQASIIVLSQVLPGPVFTALIIPAFHEFTVSSGNDMFLIVLIKYSIGIP